MATADNRTETFSSHMLKALRALTATQLELVTAQAHSSAPTEGGVRAWELLWGNLRSAASLASVIHTSAMNGVLEAIQAEIRTPAPLVPQESAEYRPLLEAIEDAIRCADQISRSTEHAFERLICAGQGESDCAQTVNMVRLYAGATQCLLEAVKLELKPENPAVRN